MVGDWDYFISFEVERDEDTDNVIICNLLLNAAHYPKCRNMRLN